MCENYSGNQKLSVEVIEKMLSDEGILEYPRILDVMDNNLTISIADFCLFFKIHKNLVFNQMNLIEELGKSKLLLFNYSKGEIQRRVKGKRRIVLFHEIPEGFSIPLFLKEIEVSNKAEKIDDSKQGIVEVYCESESEAFVMASIIERVRWEKKLSFRCQVKCENFKSQISSKLYLEQEKNPQQTKSLKESIFIILDKENYLPRFQVPEFNYDNRFNITLPLPCSASSTKESFQSSSVDGEAYLSTKEDSVELDYKEKKKQALARLDEILNGMKAKEVNKRMPLVLEKNFNENVMEKQVIYRADPSKDGQLLQKQSCFRKYGKKTGFRHKNWKKTKSTN